MNRTPITTRHERDQLDRLKRLVAHRATDEIAIRQRRAQRSAEAQQRYLDERDVATSQFEQQHGELIAALRDARDSIYSQYESSGQTLLAEEEQLRDDAEQQYNESMEDIRNARQAREKHVQDSFAEKQQAPKSELVQFRKRCDWCGAEVERISQEAQKVLRKRGITLDESMQGTPPPGLSTQDYVTRVMAILESLRTQLTRINSYPAARFVEDGWPILIFIFAAIGAAYPLWLFLQSYGWAAVVAAGVLVPLLLAVGLRQLSLRFARRQSLRWMPEFQQALAEARGDLAGAVQTALAETDRTHRRLVEHHERDLASAKSEFEHGQAKLKRRHEVRLQKAVADFRLRRATFEHSYERQLQQIEQKYPPRIRQLEQGFKQHMEEIADDYRHSCSEIRVQHDQEWSALASQWHAGIAEFAAAVTDMNAYCDGRFPAWKESREGTDAASNLQRAAADRDVPAIRFGRFQFALGQLPGGLPHDDELRIDRTSFELPAVLSYPDCPSLLLEAEGDGRDMATSTIQNVMLRLLTTFPPGKVRFTIIDPVGLGQNFSAFMHLADYDERLVANRIWTESAHINQRLTDLTEHMENVIQKYLRNEFESIQQYNEHAGEVAEPFQILVVANFPANFSDEAARRLVSIASSGSRCGVYTLISTDTKLKLPRNFDLADLEAPAATLVWDESGRRFAWKYDDLRDLPLDVESPPDDEHFTNLVRLVGRGAKDASRVEVPFEMVVPEDAHWWSSDSRAEIEVPLGRAGAKKLQYMRLGKGTSQHVLISGKTGSGKSTLLNAIITNLAMHYSPEELQFYLIDFKKGVEFKGYATHRLPHARVIAIESEREFGMSVLERLDLELRRRGDLFRKFGVQDLKSFRGADPQTPMPRILLVIDEFQEFFTSDDRISHDSALLLDRLVRQGRAFGIHVLLGSQTLAGAYSLARSTIGQMAVRIALQCSESDAHLILSEDNTAARLLSRPGEAIYNDANGLFEGNHPFQVVWLPDDRREHYLSRLNELAVRRGLNLAPPTVFEGNAAADPAENILLRAAIESAQAAGAAAAAAPAVTPRAWLGAAVAIKDPTDAQFRRQGGANLLIVGQQEELALGILTNCVVSLETLPASNKAEATEGLGHRGIVLDGTRPESPEAGFWNRLQRKVPLDVEVVTPRDAVSAVTRLAREVDRRLATGEPTAESLFLVIYNLARFRDLRKSDDFGMSSFDDDEKVDGGKQISKVLRDGPAVGIHTIVWCDSYNSLNRMFDRSMLRDLEMRVLFQMNATDSSNLMDSPAASKLGAHMAILYSEEHGHAEKFRPYGMPTPEWLDWLGLHLVARPAAPTGGRPDVSRSA